MIKKVALNVAYSLVKGTTDDGKICLLLPTSVDFKASYKKQFKFNLPNKKPLVIAY